MPTQFCLRAPILAIRRENEGRPTFATLQPGDRVYIVDGMNDAGMVEILSQDGIKYTLFYSDLIERSESARAAAS